MLKKLLSLAFAVAALLAAAPSFAADGDIIVEGSCSGASTWKLKVGPEDAGLDGEFEVDQNVNDQVWRVRITQNGVIVFNGTAITEPPSGSFTVDFGPVADQAGDDTFRATARNQSTGERCRAILVFPE